MDSYDMNIYAPQGIGGGVDYMSQLPTGKKQFPQSRATSGVIVEDADEGARKPSYGYGGSRKSMMNNEQFIQNQSNEVRKIKNIPVAGTAKRADPNEKNWFRYSEEEPTGARNALRGKSSSLANKEVKGSNPKSFGFIGAPSVSAGVSSGIQNKSKQSEAPWGYGGNFDATSYGKKWLDKTDKGIKSGPKKATTTKPNMMDSIDQERVRLESREASSKGKGAYGDFYELPVKDVAPQATNQKSYMEQKKEEYAKYLAEQNQSSQYQPVQSYADEDQDYYNQELRKQQMEYELAQQMKKMNKENQENYEPENYYQNNYPDYQAYQAPIVSKKPVNHTAAGGKSIRKESEDNKFTLSGYQNPELKELNKNKVISGYEPSSKAYGNQNIEKMGPILNPAILKVHGIQSYSKDKGFNVITGEYTG